MPGGSSFRDEGKIFVVVAGGDYKEGRLYPGTVQRGQNVRRRLAGAVVEGQENPLRVVDLPDQRREQVTDYFGRLEFMTRKNTPAEYGIDKDSTKSPIFNRRSSGAFAL